MNSDEETLSTSSALADEFGDESEWVEMKHSPFYQGIGLHLIVIKGNIEAYAIFNVLGHVRFIFPEKTKAPDLEVDTKIPLSSDNLLEIGENEQNDEIGEPDEDEKTDQELTDCKKDTTSDNTQHTEDGAEVQIARKCAYKEQDLGELLKMLEEAEGRELPLEASLELSCVDVAMCAGDNAISYVASCWAVVDNSGIPIRHIAALFTIDKQFQVRLTKGAQIPLRVPVIYCRLTTPSDSSHNRYCWILFPRKSFVTLYTVNTEKETAEFVESVHDYYPELELGNLPGAATISSCLSTPTHRWSVVGFNTGHVVISVSSKSNWILDRKTILFANVVSILSFNVRHNDEVCLLVSSTTGPLCIWSLRVVEDSIERHMLTKLMIPQRHDILMCLAFDSRYVAVGTFDEHVHFFYMADIETADENGLEAFHSLKITGRPRRMTFLPDGALAVLSDVGLHVYELIEPTKVEASESTLDELSDEDDL